MVKRATWRPERRNKNIGTGASGYGQSNKLEIPESWKDRYGQLATLYYERLSPDDVLTAQIGNHAVKFLYEAPKDGYTYGCTPSDVIGLLSACAEQFSSLPEIVAFRQPTRKQRILEPVWGRLIYFAEFGFCEGPAIFLEAQKLGGILRYPKKMGLEERAEFCRLQDDGHEFTEEKRYFETSLEFQTIRNTVLYRTLLHELGHWDQYNKEVLQRETGSAEDETLWALYCAKPSSEKEVYAHSFAAQLAEMLKSKNLIPFPPLPFDHDRQ